MPSDDLYFRQLLSGRDFARTDPLAEQMANFVYAIGDRTAGECVLVDPAYAVNELVDAVNADGMNVVGVLATHFHPDHVGGSMMGHTIEGVAALLERCDCPVLVNRHEAEFVRKTTGLTDQHLSQHDSGDVIHVGNVDIALVHTPGHTPGSQCFHVRDRLVSGDTLFLEGCGRTDFPGSNPGDMYDSLQRLAAMPDGTVVYPGHRYSIPSSATIDTIRADNYVFRPTTKSQWLEMFAN